MSERLRQQALAGLMAGKLDQLVPYLRAFEDSALSMAADMIDGTICGSRIVIEAPNEHRTRRRHDEIAVFVAALIAKGEVLKEAVHQATKLFEVSKRTVMTAWSSYNEFERDMDAKAAAYLARQDHE